MHAIQRCIRNKLSKYHRSADLSHANAEWLDQLSKKYWVQYFDEGGMLGT